VGEDRTSFVLAFLARGNAGKKDCANSPGEATKSDASDQFGILGKRCGLTGRERSAALIASLDMRSALKGMTKNSSAV